MNRRYLPLACALIALAIRGITLVFFQDSAMYQPAEGSRHDRAIYFEAAEAASNGIFFSEGALEHLPLYPWLLGIVGMIFGTGPLTAAVLSILFDCTTTLLIVLFARRLGAPNRVAAIAAILYAAYPLAVIYSLLAMPNTLNTLLVTVFAYCAHFLLAGSGSAGASPSLKNPAALVQFFALGILAGVVTLGFAGMILIALAVAAIAFFKTRSWLVPVLFLIGMAIPVSPVAIHNSRAEGSFVLLTTHGGFNFYMGNHERATGYTLKVNNFRMTAKEMLEDAHGYAEQSAGRPLTRAESSAWWNRQAKAFWKSDPAHAMKLTLKKVALFWNFREMDDLRILEQLRVTEPFFKAVHGTPFAVFGILGLIGLFYSRAAAIPKCTMLVGMTGIVFFFITARYRLTFVPLMGVIGAAGIPQIAAAWNSANYKKLLAIIPIILFVLIPFSIRDQRAVDYHNTAIMLISDNKPGEAMDLVNNGLELDPNFGPLYFVRGNILYAQKDYAEAAAAYRTAMALTPGNPTASFNLALCLAQTGDYCAARDVLEATAGDSTLSEKSQRLLRELTAACDQP